MSKIIKENGKYKIEFAKDSFGPYEFVFSRTDCYYNDKLQDRGSILFPYKNKEFNNTEIFLETDDIVICTGDRTNLSGEEKTFIDIINLKTEKKQRLYVDEVNLIYNGENEIVINGNFDGVWKTIKLDNETMEIKEEKEEKLLAFFKVLYKENEKKWYRLDWDGNTFFFKDLNISIIEFYIFNRDKFFLKLNDYSLADHHLIKFADFYYLDIWELSGGNFSFNNLTFINNQNYVLSKKLRKKVLYFKYSPLTSLIGIISFIPILIVFSYKIINLVLIDIIGDILILFGFFLIINLILFGNIYRYFYDLKMAYVYKISMSNKFNIKDFTIIRKNNRKTSQNQKIMIK